MFHESNINKILNDWLHSKHCVLNVVDYDDDISKVENEDFIRKKRKIYDLIINDEKTDIKVNFYNFKIIMNLIKINKDIIYKEFKIRISHIKIYIDNFQMIFYLDRFLFNNIDISSTIRVNEYGQIFINNIISDYKQLINLTLYSSEYDCLKFQILVSLPFKNIKNDIYLLVTNQNNEEIKVKKLTNFSVNLKVKDLLTSHLINELTVNLLIYKILLHSDLKKLDSNKFYKNSNINFEGNNINFNSNKFKISKEVSININMQKNNGNDNGIKKNCISVIDKSNNDSKKSLIHENDNGEKVKFKIVN